MQSKKILYTRRDIFRLSSGLLTLGLLQACTTQQKTLQKLAYSHHSYQVTPNMPYTNTSSENNTNTLRIFASSGSLGDAANIDIALLRLYRAGFIVSNESAALRKFQRFAGSDEERVHDFQAVIDGSISMPKIWLAARGGYGAMRLLPYINWNRLGKMMNDSGSILIGFSDVTAIQLALLAAAGTVSFSGPMLYSDFNKPIPSQTTMAEFVHCMTQPQYSIQVISTTTPSIQQNIVGTLWGGNLSVLHALIGTPYFPKIKQGILFLEDVSEPPYRIERMLQTLHLAGILKQQQAIILGHFKYTENDDMETYNLNNVVQTISRITNIPIFRDFPFGHVADKVTFPLGAQAVIEPLEDFGYQVTFNGYPLINNNQMHYDALFSDINELI